MIFNGKEQYWLPYSVGCIWAYANQFSWVKETFILKQLFFSRNKIDDVVAGLENPAVCGFSCYVWNEQYCLAAAESIKKQYPNCKIVFGGPQVNLDILDEYNFIDSVILGEGEKNFTKLLFALKNDEALQEVYFAERITDLSELPSPYTTGVFDKIISDHPNALWQMTFETNRGCPFSCTFCDWGSLTYSKVKQYDISKVEEEIIWIKNNPISYVFLADANFGIFKERDLEIAKLLHEHLEHSAVDTINVQFTKNSNEVVIDIAKSLGRLCRGISLSAQSMNDKTLDTIKRKNMAINKLSEMFQLIRDAGIGSYTELILGMPDETLESWKTGVADLLELGQHNHIDVWFTQMLKNSEMSSKQSLKTHGIKTTRVKDYIFIFNDFDEISEYIDIIKETNTMTTEEMVDAYMYSWIIIHFHIHGYTQILSRYSRNEGISYRKFYDTLITHLKNSSLIQNHYIAIRQSIDMYLRGNPTVEKVSAHSWMHTESHSFFYEHKNEVLGIGEKTFRSLFSTPNEDIIIFQQNIIHDKNEIYPKSLTLNFDHKEMKSSGPILYIIDSKYNLTADSYAVRRNNSFSIKNIVLQG